MREKFHTLFSSFYGNAVQFDMRPVPFRAEFLGNDRLRHGPAELSRYRTSGGICPELEQKWTDSNDCEADSKSAALSLFLM